MDRRDPYHGQGDLASQPGRPAPARRGTAEARLPLRRVAAGPDPGRGDGGSRQTGNPATTKPVTGNPASTKPVTDKPAHSPGLASPLHADPHGTSARTLGHGGPGVCTSEADLFRDACKAGTVRDSARTFSAEPVCVATVCATIFNTRAIITRTFVRGDVLPGTPDACPADPSSANSGTRTPFVDDTGAGARDARFAQRCLATDCRAARAVAHSRCAADPAVAREHVGSQGHCAPPVPRLRFGASGSAPRFQRHRPQQRGDLGSRISGAHHAAHDGKSRRAGAQHIRRTG